jgi:hypothetical protein
MSNSDERRYVDKCHSLVRDDCTEPGGSPTTEWSVSRWLHFAGPMPMPRLLQSLDKRRGCRSAASASAVERVGGSQGKGAKAADPIIADSQLEPGCCLGMF